MTIIFLKSHMYLMLLDRKNREEQHILRLRVWDQLIF